MIRFHVNFMSNINHLGLSLKKRFPSNGGMCKLCKDYIKSTMSSVDDGRSKEGKLFIWMLLISPLRWVELTTCGLLDRNVNHTATRDTPAHYLINNNFYPINHYVISIKQYIRLHECPHKRAVFILLISISIVLIV